MLFADLVFPSPETLKKSGSGAALRQEKSSQVKSIMAHGELSGGRRFPVKVRSVRRPLMRDSIAAPEAFASCPE